MQILQSIRDWVSQKRPFLRKSLYMTLEIDRNPGTAVLLTREHKQYNSNQTTKARVSRKDDFKKKASQLA